MSILKISQWQDLETELQHKDCEINQKCPEINPPSNPLVLLRYYQMLADRHCATRNSGGLPRVIVVGRAAQIWATWPNSYVSPQLPQLQYPKWGFAFCGSDCSHFHCLRELHTCSMVTKIAIHKPKTSERFAPIASTAKEHEAPEDMFAYDKWKQTCTMAFKLKSIPKAFERFAPIAFTAKENEAPKDMSTYYKRMQPCSLACSTRTMALSDSRLVSPASPLFAQSVTIKVCEVCHVERL